MGTREDTAEHVRKRVHAERERQKTTMAQLAQALTARGIRTYATTIAKIEAGDRAVRIEELAAMAEIFDVPVDSLLGPRGRPDGKLALVMRGGEDAAHTALRDIRVHLRTIAELSDNLAVITADTQPRPQLQQVIDQAQQVIRDLRVASASLIGLVALAMPLSAPLDSEGASDGEA
jgi:transcriptional regulator with XRE-family HTH domain